MVFTNYLEDIALADGRMHHRDSLVRLMVLVCWDWATAEIFRLSVRFRARTCLLERRRDLITGSISKGR